MRRYPTWHIHCSCVLVGLPFERGGLWVEHLGRRGTGRSEEFITGAFEIAPTRRMMHRRTNRLLIMRWEHLRILARDDVEVLIPQVLLILLNLVFRITHADQNLPRILLLRLLIESLFSPFRDKIGSIVVP